MVLLGGMGIYGTGRSATTRLPIYGIPKTGPCPTIVEDCSQVQAMSEYIAQLSNIIGNLDRNKKLTIADTALDRMSADISAKIAALQ